MNRRGILLVVVMSCAAVMILAGAAWSGALRLGASGRSDNLFSEEVLKVLHTPGEAILYSLKPRKGPEPKTQGFHGYLVWGETKLDAGQSVRAARAFEDAVAGWDGIFAMCFHPRHAMRITVEGHVYDLLLCYECHQVYVYKDDALLESLGAAGSSGVLDTFLRVAKIPRSP